MYASSPSDLISVGEIPNRRRNAIVQKEKNSRDDLKASERLIIALDFDSREQALGLVRLLGRRIGIYKIGYQLFLHEGMQFVNELAAMGKRIFLDLKMGDINRTISAALGAVPNGVEMVTVNGGASTVAAAKQGRGGRTRPLILSLTFLSSLDQNDLRELMMNQELDLDQYVMTFTRRSVEAGCDGVVASGDSIQEIRQRFGDGLVIVAPGVRPEGMDRNDHKRALTPALAVGYGADYLVVGRPITQAKNSVEVAEAVINEMNSAFSERKN